MWKITRNVPSGKHTKNHGKSQFLMGKLTINGPFSIAMLVYQRVDIFGTGFPMAFPPLFGAVKIPKSWVSPVDAARHRNKIRTITLWSIFGSPHQKT